MSLPNECSIYCSKCSTFNIGDKNCFCDECFEKLKNEIKAKARNEEIEFLEYLKDDKHTNFKIPDWMKEYICEEIKELKQKLQEGK